VNEKNKQLATSLEKQYETQKKETIIKLQDVQLASRKRLNYFLGGTAILLMIISLLLFRTYRQKQKLQQQRIRELETEQRLNATQSVLKGEEQERARLAKDLHDGLSGMLSGVKYSLQDMKGNLIMTQENQQAFERSIDMLDSSIKEMRRVAHNLMPEVLVRYGLDAALKDYITEINKTGIITVIYHSMGITKKEIDHTTAIVVYRIIQELLNNVIKHAQATEVLVQLLRENDKLVVNVEDNGKGFDTKLAEEKMGMGWENIRSRMELLNGTIDIQSAPENGTAVNLEINIV
jgi:signal transduction histidine kinase